MTSNYRWPFQKVREAPPTLHWDAGNRFENKTRQPWENKAIAEGKLTFFQRLGVTSGRFRFHYAIVVVYVGTAFVLAVPFYMEFRHQLKALLGLPIHDFRSQYTRTRARGGLEEAEWYVVERAKAIERAKAKAAAAH